MEPPHCNMHLHTRAVAATDVPPQQVEACCRRFPTGGGWRGEGLLQTLRSAVGLAGVLDGAPTQLAEDAAQHGPPRAAKLARRQSSAHAERARRRPAPSRGSSGRGGGGKGSGGVRCVEEVQGPRPLPAPVQSAQASVVRDGVGTQCLRSCDLQQVERLSPLLTSSASADGRIQRGCRGRQARRLHLAEQEQCLRPLLALFAGADGGVVSDDSRSHTARWHLAQQGQGVLPLQALLAGTQQCTERDVVRQKAVPPHVAHQHEGLKPALPLLATCDGRIPGGHGQLDTGPLTGGKELQGALPLRTHGASAHGGVQGDGLEG
mmetsp:Transcript_108059/g.345093  ORF Transcript_108059/g.345093 Transcript_108059/m.345093 type:complete len:320 (-) Transcript_108059:281-1240(-)